MKELTIKQIDKKLKKLKGKAAFYKSLANSTFSQDLFKRYNHDHKKACKKIRKLEVKKALLLSSKLTKEIIDLANDLKKTFEQGKEANKEIDNKDLGIKIKEYLMS